jgi:transposase
MSKQDTPPKPSRRQYTAEFKDDLVRRCLQPRASVSGIALENGINANVLFRWRREHLHASGRAPKRDAAKAVLLPVRMAVTPVAEVESSSVAAPTGVIEIEIGGAQVRVRGAVDEASVRRLRDLA